MNTKLPITMLPILFDELQLDTLDAKSVQLIDQIDALLPQTQCGLCGYADGCLPYAHAIVTKNETTNLCVPGGDSTSDAISRLMNRPFVAAKASKWATDPITRRPIAVHAIIDESACIGCTKCLPACPIDAIIGTAKHMHSVITPLCTGCELCVAPCPVDCISIKPVDDTDHNDIKTPQPNELKQRYHAHLNRLAKQISDNNTTVASHTQSKIANHLSTAQANKPAADDAKTAIQAAKLRTQIKKLSAQLNKTDDPNKQAELQDLQRKLLALNS